MSEIKVDKNDWIHPACPYCECVMQLNYSIWTKNSQFIDKLPKLNMYCLRCHYAVEIKPTILTCDTPHSKNPVQITCYNSSNMEASE
jgi:hypothetical protein